MILGLKQTPDLLGEVILHAGLPVVVTGQQGVLHREGQLKALQQVILCPKSVHFITMHKGLG